MPDDHVRINQSMVNQVGVNVMVTVIWFVKLFTTREFNACKDDCVHDSDFIIERFYCRYFNELLNEYYFIITFTIVIIAKKYVIVCMMMIKYYMHSNVI